jgi:uncharacterized protein (UPF0248 family)
LLVENGRKRNHVTRKNPLLEVVEAILWNMPAERRERITIIITHRGAPNDVKAIPMPEITRIDKGYIYVKKQEGEQGMDYEDEVPIPLHRVKKVVDEDGTILYEKVKVEKKDT